MPSWLRSLLKALIARVRASIRVDGPKLPDTTYAATCAEICHALYQTDLQAALQKVAESIQRNLCVDACRIWLNNRAENEVHLCVSAGSEVMGADTGDELARRVAMQGRPEICRQASAAAFPIFNGALLEAVVAIFSRAEISSQLAQVAATLAAEVGDSLERRYREEKFRAVFHHSSESILLFDETGIIDCNQATLDILACPDRALIVGHHPAEFSPEFQPDGMRSVDKSRLLDRTALQQGSHRFDWISRDLRGRSFPQEVNLTAVKLGSRVAFLSLRHDISIRKARERELEQAKQQAESANQAKGAFIVRVSQQVRTPLNGILQAARFLLDSDLHNQQRILVESIEKTSKDVLTLLNDALDLFRMQAGDLRLESAPFDLRLAIEDVVELLAPKADAKGIDLVLHYSCLLPRRAVGDAGRVRQILIHTVENAILRTDQGHVAIGLEALPADRLHLAVAIEDTGMPIPAAQRSALFEGIIDLDAANPSRSTGKGLGLTLAGKLVEYMGGKLSLTSEAGRGNRLAYEIQLDRDADEWPARRPSAAALKRRVLLVGPDNLIRVGLVQTLRDWGLEPLVTSSAEEALPWLTRDNTQAPDLVLVSNRLSGMSWEEFGRRVIDVMGEFRPALVLFVRSSETILSGAAMEAGWDSVSVRNVRMAALLDLLERTPGAGAAINRTTVSTSPIRKTVLVATDDPDTLSNVSALTLAYNLSCDRAASLEVAVDLAKQRRHDLAIVDFTQEPEQFARAVERIRTSLLDCTIPIIVVAPARVLLPGCEWLIKPLRTPELERLLVRLISGPAIPVFNQSEFIARCGGDREMAGDLSAAFRRLLPSSMSRLMESTGTQNAPAVLDCARRMRAAAAMFSAVPLIKACERLSNVTEMGDWGSAPAVASVVKAEAGRLAIQLPVRATVSEEVPV